MPKVFFDNLSIIIIRTGLKLLRTTIWIIKLSIILMMFMIQCLKDKSKDRNIDHQNTHQIVEDLLITSIDMASYLRFLKTQFN